MSHTEKLLLKAVFTIVLMGYSLAAPAMPAAFHEKMDEKDAFDAHVSRIVREGFVCPGMFTDNDRQFLNDSYAGDATNYGVTKKVLPVFAACMHQRFNPSEINLEGFDQTLIKNCSQNLQFVGCFKKSIEDALKLPQKAASLSQSAPSDENSDKSDAGW